MVVNQNKSEAVLKFDDFSLGFFVFSGTISTTVLDFFAPSSRVQKHSLRGTLRGQVAGGGRCEMGLWIGQPQRG